MVARLSPYVNVMNIVLLLIKLGFQEEAGYAKLDKMKNIERLTLIQFLKHSKCRNRWRSHAERMSSKRIDYPRNL